jgi:predicted HAD superfamily Cof-like phosphohydrolase
MSPYEDVLAFHRKFLPDGVATRPRIPDATSEDLWYALVEEEMLEVLEALKRRDLVTISDGIADAIYVLCGTAIQYGIPLPEIWQVVHEANMRKIGGPRRSDGKVLKPQDWVPPDVGGVIARHQQLSEGEHSLPSATADE